MVKKINFQVKQDTISALVSGKEGDPVAIFLHGIPASAELWREVISEVSAQGWYCLAPDCPGYGDTIVQADHTYSLEGSAELFMHWIRQQGFADIWLVGHDIGGGIAQLMVTQEEKLFKKLTLSNCATANTWPVPIIKLMIFIAGLGLFPFAARTGLAQLTGKSSLRNAFYNKNRLTPELKKRIFFDSKMSRKEGRIKFAKMLLRLTSKSTMQNMEKLARVNLPVHLVWAMNDPNQPWEVGGEILNRTLKNKQITLLEEAGHFLQVDAPEKYLKAILEGLNA